MAKPRFLYDSRLNDATPVASSTVVGFDALNLRDWRPYTWWQPVSMPATVTVDCGSPKAADFALLYSHNLGSKGATVEIHGSTDNFVGSDVTLASSTPADDSPLLLSFGSQSFRYWRLRVTGALAPSIAIAAIGAALESPVYLNDSFNPVDRVFDGQTNRSENGWPLGRIVNFEAWSTTISLLNVSWSWARNSFLPAWKAYLRGQPFGFIWDADLYPGDVRLVQVDQSDSSSNTGLSIPHRSGSLCDVVFDVIGVAP